ncbi:MAG: DUF4412 domain-containing protein [Candidatus Zhuqueibacterota bacterium]
MGNKIRIMVLVFLMFSSMHLFAQSFEGSISQKETNKMVGEEPDVTMSTVHVKNNMICMEDGKGNSYIVRPEKNVMWLVLNEQKAYVEMDFDSSMPRDIPDDIVEEDEVKPTLKKTGVTKMINGFQCEQVIESNETGNEVAEYWVTNKKSLKEVLISLSNVMANVIGDDSESGVHGNASELDGIPILTITRFFDSENISEILSIVEKPVPDDKFNIPAGYKKITLEDMIRKEMEDMSKFDG